MSPQRNAKATPSARGMTVRSNEGTGVPTPVRQRGAARDRLQLGRMLALEAGLAADRDDPTFDYASN